jgi:hypothetical protein
MQQFARFFRRGTIQVFYSYVKVSVKPTRLDTFITFVYVTEHTHAYLDLLNDTATNIAVTVFTFTPLLHPYLVLRNAPMRQALRAALLR